MIPSIRNGARAIGFSGWLAAFHSDKYSSLKTLDAGQPGTPTGLYSSGTDIWGSHVPEEPFPCQLPPKARVGFSELSGMTLATMAPPSYTDHQPFNYPPSILPSVQQSTASSSSNVTNNNVGTGLLNDELSALTLDPMGLPVVQPILDPSVDSMILEAMMSSQEQEAELQRQEFQASILAQNQIDPPALGTGCSGGNQECPSCRISVPPQVSCALNLSQDFILDAEFTGEQLIRSAVKDPGKYLVHMSAVGFDELAGAVQLHLYSLGPVPDMTLFHLFRKVTKQEEVDRALGILMDERSVRNSRGLTEPYDEVTSAAVFNALNRAGGDEFVVAAAEQHSRLGLMLSRSNMYHLMKQYSVQGKVNFVERLFRALDSAGKSWNSNCVVIMMLAYFNQGKFEEADMLRKELHARGIKISERIESRLDRLLSGEESWLWEDKVWRRPQQQVKPRGLSLLAHDEPSGLANARPFNMNRGIVRHAQPNDHEHLHQRGLHTSERASAYMAESVDGDHPEVLSRMGPMPTLNEAVIEPRQNLTQLRIAGFDELCSTLDEMIDTSGPVECVCISFLFRKVETRREVEKAMALLEKDRKARRRVGFTEDYNETTCSRIFNALFRANAADLALEYAGSAKQSGLMLSGKALHELLKSFATRNDIDRVRDIWKLVKENGKPSSRIVYSIFRTYFDNNLMEEAAEFRKEIREMGINLSASATRNIEEVLSGNKNWVKDPKDI